MLPNDPRIQKSIQARNNLLKKRQARFEPDTRTYHRQDSDNFRDNKDYYANRSDNYSRENDALYEKKNNSYHSLSGHDPRFKRADPRDDHYGDYRYDAPRNARPYPRDDLYSRPPMDAPHDPRAKGGQWKKSGRSRSRSN